VSVAYLIRAHHDPAHLTRLIERLADGRTSFYLHVSALTPRETYDEMRDSLAARDDVVWVPRVKTRYGGFSLVRATLAGLRQMLEAGDLPGHVVQLSGQDYPLQPPDRINPLLARREGQTLLAHYALPAREWEGEHGGMDRLRYWHFERIAFRGRVARIPVLKRRLPQGLEPYGGSAFWALSADAVRYIDRFARDNASVMRFFEHTLIADELFVHTVLLNSPLRDQVVNESIHYVDWPGGVHPKTLRAEDFPRLRESGKLFARKFDERVDPEVLDLIDRDLLERSEEQAGAR
jgi:Core-2/I-Branching enzyme